MKRALVLVIVWAWTQALLIKRFFFPRPFRVVAIRRRCPCCQRRMRGRIADVPTVCRRCSKKQKGRRWPAAK